MSMDQLAHALIEVLEMLSNAPGFQNATASWEDDDVTMTLSASRTVEATP